MEQASTCPLNLEVSPTRASGHWAEADSPQGPPFFLQVLRKQILATILVPNMQPQGPVQATWWTNWKQGGIFSSR